MSETIEEKCLLKGVKLTDQRKVIAQVMSQSSDHPDVDELYKRVSNIVDQEQTDKEENKYLTLSYREQISLGVFELACILMSYSFARSL